MADPNSKEHALEGTFAMIKPDAIDRAGLIFTRIVKEGFLVVEQQRFRYVDFFLLIKMLKGTKFQNVISNSIQLNGINRIISNKVQVIQ